MLLKVLIKQIFDFGKESITEGGGVPNRRRPLGEILTSFHPQVVLRLSEILFITFIVIKATLVIVDWPQLGHDHPKTC